MELEEFLENSKVNTQTFLARLNHEAKNDFEGFECGCKDLREEGFPPEYKCIFCILDKQVKGKHHLLT